MSKGKSKKKSGKKAEPTPTTTAKLDVETLVAELPVVDDGAPAAEATPGDWTPVTDLREASPAAEQDAEAAPAEARDDAADSVETADAVKTEGEASAPEEATLDAPAPSPSPELSQDAGAEGDAPVIPKAPKMAARRPRTPRRQIPDPAQEVLPDVLPNDSPSAQSIEDLATWHGFDPETTVDLRSAPEIFAPVRDDAAPPPTVPPPDADGEAVNHHLRGLLEALIFASDKAIKTAELARSAKAQIKEVREVLADLRKHYASRGIVLDEVAGGWLFRTSVVYAPFVRDLTGQKPVKLTRAQLETLAILAYRQPITRPEIDEIRGVDSGPVLKMLLERDFIRILGKKDEVGRPILYGTTPAFLEFFNLKSLKDMPTLKEFTELNDESRVIAERELGEPFDAATERALAEQALKAEAGEGEGDVSLEGADMAASEEETTTPDAGADAPPGEETEWSSPIEESDPEADAAADAAEAAEADDDDAPRAARDIDEDPITEVSAKARFVEEAEDADDAEDAEDAAAEDEEDAAEDASSPKVSAADEEEFPDDDDSEFEDDDDDDWDDDDDDADDEDAADDDDGADDDDAPKEETDEDA